MWGAYAFKLYCKGKWKVFTNNSVDSRIPENSFNGTETLHGFM